MCNDCCQIMKRKNMKNKNIKFQSRYTCHHICRHVPLPINSVLQYDPNRTNLWITVYATISQLFTVPYPQEDCMWAPGCGQGFANLLSHATVQRARCCTMFIEGLCAGLQQPMIESHQNKKKEPLNYQDKFDNFFAFVYFYKKINYRVYFEL